jgi:hypothetical protein
MLAGHGFSRVLPQKEVHLTFDESQAHPFYSSVKRDELKLRDRQLSHRLLTFKNCFPKLRNPQGHPPPTFLFLPIQLSNSEVYLTQPKLPFVYPVSACAKPIRPA